MPELLSGATSECKLRGCQLNAVAAEVEQLMALAKRLSDALREVRPLGGSEMFIRVGEEFYVDPSQGSQLIRELREELYEMRLAEARARKFK